MTAPRGLLAAALAATVALGVATRTVRLGVPAWDKSLGDALYAVAVFLGLALLAPRRAPWALGLAAFGACVAIEVFQATGVPLALAARRPWVAWVLGTGFSWHDIACYAVGVAASVGLAARLARPPRIR